ncbi:tectonic-3-like isoform X2 [Nerophis lumbriciformis]|uniref:tectonic-3-like isoform X2 n=1 Tax=Nerophis lumbriciformis TaxID=546530 RepID=UPI002AE00E2B|nr:tectonic-3-like isoform X2 [Nerophis lumbriciformis]
MNYRQWCRIHLYVCFLFGSFAQTLTETGTTPTTTSNSTSLEPVGPTTPSPGVTDGVNSSSSPTERIEAVSDSTGTVERPLTDNGLTFTPAGRSPAVIPACVCDLTPDFCDIGCCCDMVDCGIDNLTTIFSGCPQKAISGDCIEKWMMFHTNVDLSSVTVTDSLFCVHSEDDTFKVSVSPPQSPALGDSYHFSPPKPTGVGHSRPFYRADDVIQTFFPTSSVRGLLRQPSPGATTVMCLNRNPARFLRSQSLSCTRMVTPQSCTEDSNLSALSYHSDLSLVKIPKPEKEQVSDFLIAVSPVSDWPVPSEQNNTCVNVAKKVDFVIAYTDRGELAEATVNVLLADVKMEQLLQQVHSVQFKLVTSSQSTRQPTPTVGLRVGAAVIGRFNGAAEPVTIMGVSLGGACSSRLSARAIIPFAHNTITGCTLKSSSEDCSEMRSRIYDILRGTAIPDVMAMNSGSEPDWTRVLKQECLVNSEETCDSGCTLPYRLSVQVLWAHMGLLHLPQSYILGAKYLFQCRKFKCPLVSPVTLTTEVAFADMTVYPKPFRGLGSI